MMSSEYTLKRLGDRIHPGRSPLPMLNHSVLPTPVLTAYSWSSYSLLTQPILHKLTQPILHEHGMKWNKIVNTQ